jgi:hypothetical protein
VGERRPRLLRTRRLSQPAPVPDWGGFFASSRMACVGDLRGSAASCRRRSSRRARLAARRSLRRCLKLATVRPSFRSALSVSHASRVDLRRRGTVPPGARVPFRYRLVPLPSTPRLAGLPSLRSAPFPPAFCNWLQLRPTSLSGNPEVCWAPVLMCGIHRLYAPGGSPRNGSGRPCQPDPARCTALVSLRGRDLQL